MTPAERAVIEAAMSWDWTPSETGKLVKLNDACKALRAERASVPTEEMRKWSDVVTEDEIYSTKTKKWYRVLNMVSAADNGKAYVKVQCEGMAKPFMVPAAAEVLVRRSEMGQAVDMWIDVMRSGPA